MIKFKEVTKTKERKFNHPYRNVVLPRLTQHPFGTEEHNEWIFENMWLVNFSVRDYNKAQAVQLAFELDSVYKANPEDPKIKEILAELRGMRINTFGDKSALETWELGAYQMVNYCGCPNVWDLIAHEIDLYSGEVLEAMCGHHSYFLTEKEGRNITALDYCEESLEKYSHPARRRICCDLNQINGNNTLHLFQDESFDVVSICFGYKYVKHILNLLREFHRILKPDGVLSFVENPRSGYEQFYKRQFRVDNAEKLLLKAGFKHVTFKEFKRVGDLVNNNIDYHLEAFKQT